MTNPNTDEAIAAVIAKYGTENDDDTPFHNGDAGTQTGVLPSLPERAEAWYEQHEQGVSLTEYARQIIEQAEE